MTGFYFLFKQGNGSMHLYEQAIQTSANRDGSFKVVMRMQPMNPEDVYGLIWHGERHSEDQRSHIVEAKKHLKHTMIGDEDVSKKIKKRTREMAKHNRRSSLLRRKFRTKKDFDDAVINTPLENPWRKNTKSKGPLREGIISVNRKFFEADETTKEKDRIEFLDDSGDLVTHDVEKYRQFYTATKRYLNETFGDDCVYARFDGDEMSGHVHFLIAKEVFIMPSVRYPEGRFNWKATDHELIGGVKDGPRKRKEWDNELYVINKEPLKKRGYELLQNHIGRYFETEYPDMKIVRGERRAQLKRITQKKGERVLATAKVAGEHIPNGSKDGQILFLLKKRIAETKEKGKMRLDERQKLALDYMSALGIITEDVRNEASTRRARKKLLDSLEAMYGSAEDILSEPDRVADIHAERWKRHRADMMAMLENRESAVALRESDAYDSEIANEQKEAKLNALAAELDAQKSQNDHDATVNEKAAVENEKRAAELDAKEAEIRQNGEIWRQLKEEGGIKFRIATALRKALAEDHGPSIAYLQGLEASYKSAHKPMSAEGAFAATETTAPPADVAPLTPTIPGTFLVPEIKSQEDLVVLNEKLKNMTNREVRARAVTCHDAARFLDPGDEKDQAARGWKVLRSEAERRGINLNTGEQDMTKATDKERAKLHTDQGTEKVLEVRKKNVRVRSR
ncbi:hypothetical protein R5H30_01160 [Sulfitobacter sp. D35]|uniref:hypothetical protein n=1 Tax=Sulfitobacter sp. D35 TaxID=3083252 RepID=UPI00296E4DB3|nr:hypothetical protein [Sulfitobacter sp. D35]MDW4496573.1 hypothetical protein [Sulfitobacter sp. D35]